MDEHPRSLWEMLDSDSEPWRRGRIILIGIAAIHLIVQTVMLVSTGANGNIERALVLAVGTVVFWFLFYLVWIGVHWVRWIWGGWNMIAGFCLLIWAWRDQDGVETLEGTITFLIGFYLCFSPSIYFFARRQREHIRWGETVLIGIVCFLLLGSIATSGVALAVLRERWRSDAFQFAIEAQHRIYHDRDFAWVSAHVTQDPPNSPGSDRLRQFFKSNSGQLGHVGKMDDPRLQIHFRIGWPLTVSADARADGRAETDGGPVELHETLRSERGGEWELVHMWWTYLPLPDPRHS